MTRRLRLLGMVLALGLVLTACGDDSEDGDEGASEDAGATEDGGGDGGPDCDGDVCLAGIQFQPDSVEVAVGDTVTWASIDSPDHTVTADDDSFDSGTLGNGDTFEVTFDEAGDIAYHCEIHPSMTGTVTVS